MEKITSNTWKFVGYGYDDDADYSLSTTENDLLTCEKDDIITFYADSTGADAEGPVKCGTTTVYNFHWDISKDGSKFTWNLYGGTQTYTLKTLNDSELLFYRDELVSGVTRKYVYKFAR